jgi:hypothetical protein
MILRPPRLDAREYKLLLSSTAARSDPDARRAISREADARAVWERVVSVLARRNSTNGPAPFPASGSLATAKTRIIQFWDTDQGTFDAAGVSVRWRADQARDAGELTLKLRTPDLFVAAAAAALPETNKSVKTKLEEDISPLAIAASGGDTPHACFASPPSMRSRFSLSMETNLEQCPRLMKDLLALFPSLPALIGRDIDAATLAEPLIGGPRIRETVYKGATVDFGDGFSGAFALSVWDLETTSPAHIAELSYRCKLADGTMTLAAARRAGDLFVTLQSELADHLDRQATSKTVFALPKPASAT